ncbi:MAG: hemerythrin domain-containing protein [Solirubrobacterales bacterium]|nr:hemerythrin domain-containing protein [Solirubrobacterales bacterium]
MKRSEALKPLSREHHQALYTAKVVRDQEGEGDSRQRLLAFWREEAVVHFRIEEEVLLPGSGLKGPDQDEGVARMLTDHLELRRMFGRIQTGEVSPDELVEFAERLVAHVRFEERDLFPRIESEMSEDQLRALEDAIQEAEEEARGI